MSAWIPVTPPRPVGRPGALGAAHLGPADPEAGPAAGLEVAAEPLDQRREVRLVRFRRLQVGGDAGQHLLERLAEQPVHVVPPDLAELAPVTLDGREVLGQVVIEPHQVRPELGQRLDIVDNPRHAPSPTWYPGLLLRGIPAWPPAQALELGGELVQAHGDDIRVLRDSAGGDVLYPAVIGDLDLLLSHERADGRGQRRQEAVHFPVPVRVFLRYLAEHGPQRADGVADRGRRHGVADDPQLLAVALPDRVPQHQAQLGGGGLLPGTGQEAGQRAYVVPVSALDQRPGQRQAAADHLRPEQAGVRVGVDELSLPLAAVVVRSQGSLAGTGVEQARPPGCLQQLRAEEKQVLAFGGQLPGPLLIPGQQPAGEDGWPDRLAQGQVGGRGFSHGVLRNPSLAKASNEAVEYGLNFSTCSTGHSVSRYRARSSSRLAAAATPSSASLSAGDSTRSTARRPKKPMPARRSARSAVA